MLCQAKCMAANLEVNNLWEIKIHSMLDPYAQLAGYQINEKIYESFKTLVYRGIRVCDRQAVTIKLPKNPYPSAAEQIKFQNQYAIAQSLDISGIVKPYSLERYGNSYALVMEYGGVSLSEYFVNEAVPVVDFLAIAIQLTVILEGLYRHRVIHKDIKPANILIDPTSKQVKLIDFSLASSLPKETQDIQPPNLLEGTLAYLSPEQSGRMNRIVDYRTDYYSLGITFYQLLTGELPFKTNDALELVYCHLARRPVPPCEVNSQVPKVLSTIVTKLIAKAPEERYQSAWGIRADLEICLKQLQTTGKINNFAIARHDISERLQIPQKLYGREREIAALLTAFERISQPNSFGCELILVLGNSGIGKSTLVGEIYKPITEKKGYFIAGKFEQFQRHIPYFAITKAFSNFIKQLLTENEEKLKQWREKILKQISPNEHILSDFIPEIQLLIGKQSEEVQASFFELQNRFNLVFLQFLRVFCQPSSPLVIFLDDLQWVDSHTLKLIELILTDLELRHLLVVGTYRDKEVNSSHPLTLLLEKLQDAKVTINQVVLKPLQASHIDELLAETLQSNLQEVRSLSSLVIKKTNGNPFFVEQFLKALERDKLLRKCQQAEGESKAILQKKSSACIAFSSDSKRAFQTFTSYWEWDLTKIEQLNITENVVDFTIAKIKRLPKMTQQLLAWAACIGNHFSLKTLAAIGKISLLETFETIAIAINERLILSTNNSLSIATEFPLTKPLRIYYKFVHDRILQAAYLLIDESQRTEIHLSIGQLFLKSMTEKECQENIFEIVKHINIGDRSPNSSFDKLLIARLNFLAGRRAKLSVAYESAAVYLKAGLNNLGRSSWIDNYELTLKLYLEMMEVEYLNGHYSISEKLAKLTILNVKTKLDSVNIYNFLIKLNSSQTKNLEAIAIGIKALKSLEIILPDQLGKKQLRIKLPALNSLETLPIMNEPEYLLALQILMKLCTPTYTGDPEMYPKVFLKAIDLCQQYGYAAPAAHAYISYGMFLYGLNDFERGYHAGQLAIKLVEKFQARELIAKIGLLFHGQIRHGKEHLKNTIDSLEETIVKGIEIQDLEFASYCINFACLHLFRSAQRLNYVIERQTKLIDTKYIQTRGQGFPLYYARIWQQITLNLVGQVENCTQLNGTAFDESKILPLLLKNNSRVSLAAVYLAKTIILYLFEENQPALNFAKLAINYVSGLSSTLFPWHNFYYSLILLANAKTWSFQQRKNVLKTVKANQKTLKAWANSAPMNYLHLYVLVEAEKCRVLNRKIKAIEFYDRAIYLADKHEYIGDKALAYELAAKFYIEWNKLLVAKAYLKEAHYTYQQWGAIAKVKFLETHYFPLLKIPAIGERDNTIMTIESQPSSETQVDLSERFDLETAIKISQVISSKNSSNQLLEKIVKIAIENAGAEFACLLLQEDDRAIVKITNNIKSKNAIVPGSTLAQNRNNLPVSIINYVARTQENLILNDATHELTFADDPYIQNQHPKSILCTPIVERGQLIGILYLENNLVTGAFARDRLKILKLLTAQAAISLENAKLYERLKDYSHTLEIKVAQRTADLETANQKLQRLATLDSLTQVANRRRFDEYLQQSWQRLMREQQPLSLILCDIDYFKRYNDTYGHQAGDECLKQVAQAISHSLKRPDDLAARYGGEEFAAILPNTPIEGAIQVAETISFQVQQLEIPHQRSSISDRVTLSLGISGLIPQPNNSIEILIANADRALYQAKERGRNCYARQQ
jgi:diguanylate cyclase (GGDEF)-like protein